MLEQLCLDFDAAPATEAPARERESESERTIQAKFEAYHAAHPVVYSLFKRFAREAREAGRERFGGKVIWERIRWYCDVEKGGEAPRLNNIYVSRYVRLLCEECPDLAEMFETRVLKSE